MSLGELRKNLWIISGYQVYEEQYQYPNLVPFNDV